MTTKRAHGGASLLLNVPEHRFGVGRADVVVDSKGASYVESRQQPTLSSRRFPVVSATRHLLSTTLRIDYLLASAWHQHDTSIRLQKSLVPSLKVRLRILLHGRFAVEGGRAGESQIL